MNYMKLFWKGFLKGSKRFGNRITQIINLILLSIVYFIGVGITSILAKIFRKHFLKIKLDKTAESYWEPLNLGKKPIEEYYRQF
ncbi:hypothetical protein KY366_03900 [Candidatus Woesearchaeota archaeon]|nr:hypothetical protein [Candidatus Woesearchaeota archaeon]